MQQFSDKIKKLNAKCEQLKASRKMAKARLKELEEECNQCGVSIENIDNDIATIRRTLTEREQELEEEINRIENEFGSEIQ